MLATAADFPDALSAAALAARQGAPVLLTHPDSLPDTVAEELRRLGVSRVTILGGTGVISQQVSVQLTAAGYEVDRLGGGNRYATAAAAAQAAGASGSGEVVLALGEHADPERAWPDALAAGTLAATPDHVPTLLTKAESLPVETAEALRQLGAARVLLLGGAGGISQQVEDQLIADGYAVERLAGRSRYETSVALAGRATDRFPEGALPLVFASGEAFPDALSAGALAASAGGPLVLVPGEDLGGVVDEFLRTRTDRWAGGVVIGGTGAVSARVEDQIDAAIAGAPPLPPPPPPEPAHEPQPAPAPEPQPEPEPRVVGSFEGKASWYGPGFHGRRTACGERFDRNALTTAHRSLPCGTLLRVTNTANGAQVEVRVNDRGPYSGGRVLDLSEEGARRLGYVGAGTAYVRAEILEG